MQIDWLIRKKRERLILFYNGWGMDDRPFRPLPSKQFDVLVCSDYSQQENVPALQKMLDQYKECSLVAWSMGVYFGQLHFCDSDSRVFAKKIAVNGTLCPVDDSFGIPRGIFADTLKGLDEDTLHRFRRRMCKSKKIMDKFLINSPQRNIEDLRNELQKISEISQPIARSESIYTDVIVTDRDYIMPTSNQLEFWSGSRVHILNAPHFPFYDWNCWDDIIDIVT